MYGGPAHAIRLPWQTASPVGTELTQDDCLSLYRQLLAGKRCLPGRPGALYPDSKGRANFPYTSSATQCDRTSRGRGHLSPVLGPSAGVSLARCWGALFSVQSSFEGEASPSWGGKQHTALAPRVTLYPLFTSAAGEGQTRRGRFACVDGKHRRLLSAKGDSPALSLQAPNQPADGTLGLGLLCCRGSEKLWITGRDYLERLVNCTVSHRVPSLAPWLRAGPRTPKCQSTRGKTSAGPSS